MRLSNQKHASYASKSSPCLVFPQVQQTTSQISMRATPNYSEIPPKVQNIAEIYSPLYYAPGVPIASPGIPPCCSRTSSSDLFPSALRRIRSGMVRYGTIWFSEGGPLCYAPISAIKPTINVHNIDTKPRVLYSAIAVS